MNEDSDKSPQNSGQEELEVELQQRYKSKRKRFGGKYGFGKDDEHDPEEERK